VTLKTTLAVAAAALVAVSVLIAVGRVGHTEPKSQIDQIEVGRS
jgi:hypothetical protein